jgi:penicillin-binding protein 1A
VKQRLPIRALRQRLAELAGEWNTARRVHAHLTYGLAAAFAIVALAGSLASVLFLVDLRKGLPDDAALSKIGEMDQATTVFNASDQLAFTIYKEQRIEIRLEEISPHLIHALLAIEDQRFYEHHGFDVKRMISAALRNLRHARVTQGASTITQQLARQSFLTPDKTLHRKLQELVLAARIERRYSKADILRLYLNKVYFGDGLYGAEAAARGFFGKRASDLSISEAATLAGLVKSPSSYAPTVSLQRATARRNLVLQQMLEVGAISRSQWQAARTTQLVLHDGLRAEEPHGQYFKEQVRRELVDRFGWQRVYQGGLRVFSNIDMPMQVAAEAAVADQLKALDAKRRALARRASAHKNSSPEADEEEPLQAALIAMDPVTGHVRAMVGGRDFSESPFNRAVQARRQPGSAFKPFVYATALESGYSPASLIDHLDDPVLTQQGAWTPEDEHSTGTSMTLRAGLRTSSNRAAVRLLQEVGIPRTVQYAKDLGVGDQPAVPSLALGSGEVTLESMTAAYAAFADHGLVPRPLLIRRVEDRNGVVLFQAEDVSTRAVSDATAFLMSTMMADVINAGTANNARRMGFTLPAAGKTGTTNDFNDAWFIGFTPSLVAGVWVGFDQPHTILPNGFAAQVAVPMWTTFMKSATRDDQPEWFSPPAGVTTARVCRMSGKLAAAGCNDVEVVNREGETVRQSMVYTEYFARGTQPTSFCDVHPARGIMNKLADLFTGAVKPAPPSLEDTDTVQAPATPTVTEVTVGPEVVNPPDPPKKKRGFWSRVFGRKDSKESKDNARRRNR